MAGAVSTVGKPRVQRPAWDQPTAYRVAAYARTRRSGGLPPEFTFDMISRALPDVTRDDLHKALAVTVHAGTVRKISGPLGLADERQPDRWTAG